MAEPALEQSKALLAYMVGRQNAGKTSLQMALTGADGAPVNFPGSSVERSEASRTLDGGRSLTVVDLPGIGSLDPLSPDEQLAVDYIHAHASTNASAEGVMVVVLDATKLPVELGLLKESGAVGAPMVVALNKADVATKGGATLHPAVLREALGDVPVLVTSGRDGSGTDSLLDAIVEGGVRPPAGGFSDLDPLALADRIVEGEEDQATDRIDAVVMHPIFGLPLMALVFFGVFQAIFVGADPLMGWIEAGQGALTDWVSGLIEPGALQSFINDGLIAGFGAVVIFVPQIAILMVLIAILEASGYMARAAFLLDRMLSKVGLNGRSFLPLISSFACAVPAIAATRIIEHERDRIATIVVAPLMSCSARLPVYVILIGAFFAPTVAGLVLFSMYALGIVVAALVAFVLRKTMLKGERSPLVLELPVYQWPMWKVVFRKAWTAVKAFLALAGTLIFAASIMIWLLSYYPRPAEIHEGFEAKRAAVSESAADRDQTLAKLDNKERAAYLEQSFLARAGKAVQPIFAPAGFDWRATVGILSAFPARELIVPTLGILYGLGDVDPGEYEASKLGLDDDPLAKDGLRMALQGARNPDGTKAFDMAVALALMVFFALCSQCVATLGAIKRETRSWKWPVFTFTYMTLIAWIGAVITYRVASGFV